MPGHAVAMPERGRLLLAGLGGAACLSLIATSVSAPAPRLVWNASRSAPLGLYRVYPGAAVAVGITCWNMPSWTLSVEFFFYLCFPLISRAVEKSPRQVWAS